MTTISSIQSIDMRNVSYILTTNYGGMDVAYNPSEPLQKLALQNSFMIFSTLTTYDISGASNLYMVDISGAQHISSIVGLSTLQLISTIEGTSTLQAISSAQAQSIMAAVEIDINDIINSHSVLNQIEQHNKTQFASLDFSVFKTTLYKWAALNYPDSFLAYSFPVTTPSMVSGLYSCSDGNPKSIWDYIPYCLGMSIQDWLIAYQQKVNGITLSFSVNADPYVLNIHVTRSLL
jgi:hypothetical protein